MALTQLIGPEPYQDEFLPVYAPQNTALYWIYNSTLSSQVDFKYNFTITIGGNNYLYKVPPRPVTGYGQIAFSDIVKSYVSYNLDFFDHLPVNVANTSYVCYDVKVQEEYNPGKTFSDTYYYGAGSLGLTFSTPHGFAVNDIVTIKMNNPFLDPQYNGTASITNVPNAYLIVVNKTFDTVSTLEGGTITNVLKAGGLTNSQCAWNGARQYLDYNEYDNDFSSYIYKIDASNKFLSNYENYLNVNTSTPENYSFVSKKPIFSLPVYGTSSGVQYNNTQWETLYWINSFGNNNTDYEQIKIRVVYNDGTPPASFTYSYYNHYPIYGTYKMFFSGVGPSAWNVWHPSKPIIKTNTKEYYVCLLDKTGVQVSEWRAYEIVDNCSPYKNYRVMFLNSLGAFDFWNFNWISRTTYDIGRTEFKKTLPALYNVGERGNTILSQQVQESVYLSSDWIDEAQSRYLKELIYSTEVYYVNDINQYVPLIINRNSYEIQTNLKDRLFCISFDAKMAYQQSTQNQ